MSEKVIVPEAGGYSETLLESMLERLSFPSAFFDQPVRVHGILFAAGPDSSQLARNFPLVTTLPPAPSTTSGTVIFEDISKGLNHALHN